ncbi:3-deoxy-7-phosphoheptulonate synthase, partial [Phenoliferia sp. Uapishka_3]
MNDWAPDSWRKLPVGQAFEYPDTPAGKKGLPEVLVKLNELPPLVSATEIERLKMSLAAVARGEAFLLQGGDCAELFDYCTATKIEHRLSLLLSMSLILICKLPSTDDENELAVMSSPDGSSCKIYFNAGGMKMPVVRVARMGGQYAKPRSSATEVVDGVTMPSFRGDIVNGFALSDRAPDPERLLGAYFHSSATANHMRSLLASGFASLPASQDESVPWSLPLEHVRSPELLKSYEEIVRNLSEALEFLSVVGVGGGGATKSGLSGGLESAEIFLSHEWIGDRTRAVTGAHVEFFRGIKVGPTMEPSELVRLLSIVDPNKDSGRVTLISRYGADRIEGLLPSHIKSVQESGHPVIWCCDPCHGNTKSAPGGIKTRAMHDIVSEISSSIKIHAAQGSRLGGIHLELTGDITDGVSVTECTGGSMELGEEELKMRYESYCDPRLNFEQSLDVAFLLSSQFQSVQAAKRGRPPVNGHQNILAQLSASVSRTSSVDSRGVPPTA